MKSINRKVTIHSTFICVYQPCLQIVWVTWIPSTDPLICLNFIFLSYMCANSFQCSSTLCDPRDHNPRGSSVHGILQQSILEWVAISSSRGSSRPRDPTCVFYISCIGRWILYHYSLLSWFSISAAAAKSLQSCPTLWDPIDRSPPGSSVPGILQARTLEWVAISFSNAWKWKVKVKSLSRVRL